MVDSVNVLILPDKTVAKEDIFEQLEIPVSGAHKMVHDNFAFLRSVVIASPSFNTKHK